MVIGTLELSIKIEGAFSLKDKRRVLRSLLERVRRDFRVAASEVEDQDLWNSSVVGFACVTNDTIHAESTLQHVIDLFDSNPDVAVEDAIKQIYRS